MSTTPAEQTVTTGTVTTTTPSPKADPPKADPPKNDPPAKGFPDNTPVAEMKPAEQVAYWQDKAQKHEGRNREILKLTGGKFGDDLKTELADLEKLRDGQRTDSEKAVETAKRETRASVAAEFAEKLVAAEFRGALSHVEDARRGTILSGIAFKQFLNADGDVDTDKVKQHVEAIAPVKGSSTAPRDWGQGRHGDVAKPMGSAGSAEADRRFGAQKTSS